MTRNNILYCLDCFCQESFQTISINSKKVLVAGGVFSVQLMQEIVILSKEGPAGQARHKRFCELDASSASVKKYLV